ncbi:MAG: 23S rRNA (uracil(1939)-C(5))-methyltransferase RlmD [Syntrophaceae bacterium]|nr:23S rRNA (uracil(1939)-C(5))-methyltransferase RlmD [Syntrophaceae bacterium]
MSRKVKVKIESVAFGGYGVARVDGKVIFIPYTLAGDEAWVEITGEKKNYSLGRLKEILSSSPWRVDPPCSYFGLCGGCHWQQIRYDIQGELKKEILKEILKRLGGWREIPPISVLPSPDPFGYRARVQLKSGGGSLGFYQERSHRIIDIEGCPVSHPLINETIQTLRKEKTLFEEFGEIEINISPEEKRGILILPYHPRYRRTEERLKIFLQVNPIIKGFALKGKKKWLSFGNPHLNFALFLKNLKRKEPLRLRTSPESFFQVNLNQNQKLIDTVVEFSGGGENEKILDLYAGVGNLTLPLAIHAGEVWGIEENRAAVEDATFNAERNGIRNARFIEGKVEEVLKDWKRGRPDQMILDPPRAGCRKVVDQMVRLEPEKIVYVSCEPTTLSRDLRLFSKRGYHLQKLCLIDMFPQTYHMEVVGLLTRG